jgi:hypothetical protein
MYFGVSDMIVAPKGLEYWTKSGISDDAPEWAKVEYERYHEQMNETPDENGIVKQV